MVEVNGLENWTRRFLDYTVVWGFRLLSTVIARFTLNQRRESINIITSPKMMNELLTWSLFMQTRVVRNWINILPFYLGMGKCHLRKLVNTILSLHTEKHEKKTIQISLWSKYLDSYYKVEKVDQFLKLVSDKLGKRAVRKVVLHKDCMGIITGAGGTQRQRVGKLRQNDGKGRKRWGKGLSLPSPLALCTKSFLFFCHSCL